MKTYSKLVEDIELVSGIGKQTGREIERAHNDAADPGPFGPRNQLENHGKIHKDYSLHGSGRDFFIRHDKSKKIVGHIAGERPQGGHSRSVAIGIVRIHPEHTQKKIGHSLAVAAYKHLHKKGFDIHSGDQQSPGGASIWQRLMKDPSTRRHVHAIRPDERGGMPKNLGQASKLHTGDIWVSGIGYVRNKAGTKGIRMHKYMTPKSDAAYRTTLVLKGKK